MNLGDFNVSRDTWDDTVSKCLSEIPRLANLIQHIQMRTHSQGLTLDFVIGNEITFLMVSVYLIIVSYHTT